MKLILENVRCFSGRHEIPIKPLTLLVGENSSGKTTVLATAAAALDSMRFPFGTRFNEPPFSLGSYDTIATYRGGRSGRSRSFMIGWEQEGLTVEGTFVSERGQPLPSEVRVRTGQDGGTAQLDLTMLREEARISWQDGQRTLHVKLPEVATDRLGQPLGFALMDLLFHLEARGQRTAPEPAFTRASKLLREAVRKHEAQRLRLRAFAPVRTRPRRTYDEFLEEFSPEGEDMPLALLTKLSDESFRKALDEFGQLSGLFTAVTAKQLGNRPGNPVQILVQTGGPRANLVDVGYGVSQALPLVVEALRAPGRTRFLVQQPEVHLHPRAQAALGTFLTRLVTSRRHHFVVETHSDYIVDRVRLEIARGAIPHTDVALLWFEAAGTGSTVHEIALDPLGNIVDPPTGYRDFFLQEELALLTRADHKA